MPAKHIQVNGHKYQLVTADQDELNALRQQLERHKKQAKEMFFALGYIISWIVKDEVAPKVGEEVAKDIRSRLESIRNNLRSLGWPSG